MTIDLVYQPLPVIKTGHTTVNFGSQSFVAPKPKKQKNLKEQKLT